MKRRRIVVVSGPVAGGKSQLARALADRFGGKRFSTRELLMAELAEGEEATRSTLQRVGAELDERTDGRWVAERLSRPIYESGTDLAIVDAARVAGQIEGLRRAFGREVKHVHVTASPETRAGRFEKRRSRAEITESATYGEVSADPTEAEIDGLASIADVAIDTDRVTEEDVVIRAAAQLGLLDRDHGPSVDVIVGGLYGSEGKGNIAFHLAPEYDLLIRVGGPNAAHKVYLASGDKFTHFSLPSGTKAGTAQLAIGPGSVIDPGDLLKEISECDVNTDRLSIDPQAMVIEEKDKEREQELKGRIGSTVSGTGSATARRVMREEDVRLAKEVEDLHPYIRPTSEILERAYASGARIMLEGTQGSGLSLHHGPYPYTTSRDTNVGGCLAESGVAPARVRKVVMVVRTYPIRVAGNSGPLSRELQWSDIEERSGLSGLTTTELTSKTQVLRRVGEPEWDLLRKAALLNAPTDIALTFADYLGEGNAKAWRFEELTEETLQFIDEVERVTGARVSLISTGFMPHRGIIDRRSW